MQLFNVVQLLQEPVVKMTMHKYTNYQLHWDQHIMLMDFMVALCMSSINQQSRLYMSKFIAYTIYKSYILLLIAEILI